MKRNILSIPDKYKAFIMPLALVGGFLLDIFTLNRIDRIFDNALLMSHLLVVGTTIALLFSRDTPFGRRFLSHQKIAWLQTAMVFSFGALFSGFIIFYTRSGSLLISWPFILSMLLLMLSTEFRKRYFNKLTLQIIIFYLALLSWSIFFVPVVIKKMGPWVFVLSTLVSLILIALFLELLKKINISRYLIHRKKIRYRVLGIVVLFNLLYVLNIIPPIPLSMKFDAVYYEVTKTTNGSYEVLYEQSPAYIFWEKRSRSMYWRPGEDLFVFTQVFAPTKLSTTVRHVWEQYDENHRRWIQKDVIDLAITGGRKEGYRGFTSKKNLSYGSWRVRTETTHHQTLGITRFSIHPYETQSLRLKKEVL